MLELILGCAGSGKTRAIQQKVRERIASGGICILIVPEQNSFETERRMLRLLGAKDAGRAEVYSFRRLVDYVYRQYGRPRGNVLTEGGRQILMSLALEQVSEELSFYREYRSTEELIAMLLSFEKELKQCGVTAEAFLETARQTQEEILRTKMQDIGTILLAFEALTAQSYLDPLDDLTRIVPLLERHRPFAGAVVCIDGFKDFTMQELSVLRQILQQADTVTVTFCTDHLHEAAADDLFTPVCRAASGLVRLARECGVKTAVPKILGNGGRFRREELAFLEQNLFRATPAKWDEPVKHVCCFNGKTRYDEALFVAQEIRRLVMDEGFRYRDFAVISRDLTAYRGLLDAALRQHEVAYFLDDPHRIDCEPVMQAVLCALQIACGGYLSETVFTYLKTGMVQGITVDEIALLENYTYLWKISGKRWREPWTANPDGFSPTFSEENAAQLARLNRLREQVTAPLEDLRKKTGGKTGREMAKAVYEFLLAVGADQQVLRYAEQLRGYGQFPAAEEQLRLWELLMNVLDQMAEILRDTAVSRERFLSLLQLVLSGTEIAGIPEGVDQVTVGEAGRMRPADPKVVFLIGAVEGEFPAAVSENGMFHDRERQEMIEMGLPLVSTADHMEEDERFLSYTALTSGSEKLYVTWCGMDLSGEGKAPSRIVREVRRILPRTPVLSRLILPAEQAVLSKETAFTAMAQEIRQKSQLGTALEALFSEEPDYAARCRALERAVTGSPRQFAEKSAARLLFPERLRVSASQVEKYYQCPFSYFCQYGLNAKERKPAVITELEYGSLMHYLMETMFGKVGHRDICVMEADALRERIRNAIQRYVEEQFGGTADKSRRFLYLFERLAESAAVVIRHIAEELEQSRFQPIGYEMKVSEDGDFPPLTVETKDGRAVLSGAIDRVDLCEVEGIRYVRVIDYKSGEKIFTLRDVLSGVNMQMLLYLAALTEQGALHPAGILYMPAALKKVSVSRKFSDQEKQKEQEKKLRMNGLLLEDPVLLRSMEADGKGRYIPASFNNDGSVSKNSSVIGKDAMEQVLDYVKKQVAIMAERLQDGCVDDLPLKEKGKDEGACKYCPYFPVCCHEETGSAREKEKWDKQKALEQIRQELGEEDAQ